jgi:hypothetical protein
VNPKILITISGNAIIGAVTNGDAILYVEQADTLNGIVEIETHTVTNEEFDSLLLGRNMSAKI